MRTGVVIAIAAGLIGLGLILGLSPGSAQGATKEFSCGSPWSMNAKEIARQESLDDLGNALAGSKLWDTDYRQRCEDALGTRRTFAWILVGLGAVALIGIAVVRKPEGGPTEPKPESVEPGA